MATRLYLRNTTANIGSLGAAKLSARTQTRGTTSGPNDLSTTKGSSQQSRGVSSAGQTANQNVYFGRWISAALGTNISSNTWTCGWVGMEEANQANAFFSTCVYVVTSSNTVRGYITDLDQAYEASEHPVTTAAGRVFTFGGDAVTGVQATDKLVVEVWVDASQGNTSIIDSWFYYDGTTDPLEATNNSSAASYIETPQDNLFTTGGATITGVPAAATGTTPAPVFSIAFPLVPATVTASTVAPVFRLSITSPASTATAAASGPGVSAGRPPGWVDVTLRRP